MADVDDMDFALPQDQIINDAVQEDSKQPVQPQVNLDEWKQAWMLYPAYFDTRLSVADGRRVPLNISPYLCTRLDKNLFQKGDDDASNLGEIVESDRGVGYGVPITCWHIADALSLLSPRPEVLVEEGKRYSKHFFGFGRVRVKLNQQQMGATTYYYQWNGQQYTVKSKKQLLYAVARLVPKIQKMQVEHLRSAAAQQGIPPHAYEFPIDAELFPFSRDASLTNYLRLHYGALPRFDFGDNEPSAQSGSSKSQALPSAGSSSSSSGSQSNSQKASQQKKKNKKKR
ncbi:hypothetical protein MIR68_001733 [Amoeboaphelidium protococcarum]|nr:hypothetical protein MIR68_001733 [Amoeboaphelidium protococcarum]